MNPRTAFFATAVFLAVAGCGSPDKRIVGAWEGKLKMTDIVLTLNADSSYTAKSPDDLAHGRWSSSGSDVELFKDMRETKGSSLGDSQSSQLKFSEAAGTLTLPIPNQAPIVFHRVKS